MQCWILEIRLHKVVLVGACFIDRKKANTTVYEPGRVQVKWLCDNAQKLTVKRRRRQESWRKIRIGDVELGQVFRHFLVHREHFWDYTTSILLINLQQAAYSECAWSTYGKVSLLACYSRYGLCCRTWTGTSDMALEHCSCPEDCVTSE